MNMALQMGQVLLLVLAQAAAPDGAPAPEASPDAPPPSQPGESPNEFYPPPPEYVPPARTAYRPLPLYGDKGMPELSLGAGYSSDEGFLAVAGFRYFVWNGIAPGIEGTYVTGGAGQAAYGMALATLRLVPLSTSRVALAVTGRAGRVFVVHGDDGWAAGGEVGIILMIGAGAGLEIGYEALRLLPASFCASD
ncbi:MAG TPA: hypothetical protein VH328_15690, partial [Burkholderiaceae bacterium]|nr:hypothetical protein [Burkholderiaceae bacterium]